MSEIPKAKIYTKKGDMGKTSLVDGSCVEKFNPRVEAYGTVDEVNSQIGVARSLLQETDFSNFLDPLLYKIQHHLFNVGSLLACADPQMLSKLPPLQEQHIHWLEKEIDRLSIDLPPLQNFILPAGALLTSQLHVARTLCRRAERRSAEVLQTEIQANNCLMYLNRLSDFLFVAARWVQVRQKLPEVMWDPQQ